MNYSFIDNLVKSGTNSITNAAPTRHSIFSTSYHKRNDRFFVPIKLVDAMIILSRQDVLRKSCNAKTVKWGSIFVKPMAVPLVPIPEITSFIPPRVSANI